jgi:hypothetical protein
MIVAGIGKSRFIKGIKYDFVKILNQVKFLIDERRDELIMSKKNLSRIAGVIWMITSILWATLGVIGILYVSSWVESAQSTLQDNFLVMDETLDSVRDIINETNAVISSTNQSLEILQTSISVSSSTLSDIRPLIWKTTKVVTLDVPDALEGVQVTMPSLIETAKSVDETLTWLSSFKIEIPNPFGPDWRYDLGISYNPEVPLDQALESMGQNLVDVPDELRDLDQNLSDTDSNLKLVSDDLALLADNINDTNERIKAVVPRIENFIDHVDDVQSSLQDTQNSVFEFFDLSQKIFTAILVLLIISQIPSLYMGILLVWGDPKNTKSLSSND